MFDQQNIGLSAAFFLVQFNFWFLFFIFLLFSLTGITYFAFFLLLISLLHKTGIFDCKFYNGTRFEQSLGILSNIYNEFLGSFMVIEINKAYSLNVIFTLFIGRPVSLSDLSLSIKNLIYRTTFLFGVFRSSFLNLSTIYLISSSS